jgi:hypothetical protein
MGEIALTTPHSASLAMAPLTPRRNTPGPSPLSQSPMNIHSSSPVGNVSSPKPAALRADPAVEERSTLGHGSKVRGPHKDDCAPTPIVPRKRQSAPDQDNRPHQGKRAQLPIVDVALPFSPPIVITGAPPPLSPSGSDLSLKSTGPVRCSPLNTPQLGKIDLKHFSHSISQSIAAWSDECNRLVNINKQQVGKELNATAFAMSDLNPLHPSDRPLRTRVCVKGQLKQKKSMMH